MTMANWKKLPKTEQTMARRMPEHKTTKIKVSKISHISPIFKLRVSRTVWKNSCVFIIKWISGQYKLTYHNKGDKQQI